MAKCGDEWFPLSQTVVAYDHARDAPLGDVITLDFINAGLQPGAQAGIELTLETAKELRRSGPAIAAAKFKEAEVRGKGLVLSLVLPRDELPARSCWARARVLRMGWAARTRSRPRVRPSWDGATLRIAYGHHVQIAAIYPAANKG
jgi:hypothetical protein